MTNCNEEVLSFPAVNSKKVETKFKGGDITSDGGGLLLRAVDQRFSLTKRLARLIPDSRSIEDKAFHPNNAETKSIRHCIGVRRLK